MLTQVDPDHDRPDRHRTGAQSLLQGCLSLRATRWHRPGGNAGNFSGYFPMPILGEKSASPAADPAPVWYFSAVGGR